MDDEGKIGRDMGRYLGVAGTGKMLYGYLAVGSEYMLTSRDLPGYLE